MIYVLEGHNGTGKTTYAQSLGLPIKKYAIPSFQGIKEELEENDNVVYDRLFGYNWFDKTDEELKELNEYFKTLKNVKFIKFVGTIENVRYKLEPKHRYTEEYIQKVYNSFNRIFSIMDVFEELK